MIGVIVTFRYGDDFDEHAVRRIADTARVCSSGSRRRSKASGIATISAHRFAASRPE
jgi:hypothetical protein